MENEVIHILMVDDDDDDCLFFKDALEEIKLQTIVSFVNDGELLMHYLNNDTLTLPDIIFLDINMPGKNGMECLKDIRKIDKFNDIIIVIYSTSGAEIDIQTAFANGANQYLKKPDNFITLKDRLAHLLEGLIFTPQISY